MSTVTKFQMDFFHFATTATTNGIGLYIDEKERKVFTVAADGIGGLAALSAVYSAILHVKLNNAINTKNTKELTFNSKPPLFPAIVCELQDDKQTVVIYFEEHPTLKVSHMVLERGFRG